MVLVENHFPLKNKRNFERIVIYEYQKASDQRKAEIIRQQMSEIDNFYLNSKNIIKCKEDAAHYLLLSTIVDARIKIIDLLLNK